DHPLMHNPLYSVPPPSSLLSSYLAPTATSAAAIEAAENARFEAARNWLLVNYAFCKSAFMGKGGVISLVDGELGSIQSLKVFMRPYAIKDEKKTISPVDAWVEHPMRVHIDKIETRSELACSQGAAPVGADGRDHHGGGGARIRPWDTI